MSTPRLYHPPLDVTGVSRVHERAVLQHMDDVRRPSFFRRDDGQAVRRRLQKGQTEGLPESAVHEYPSPLRDPIVQRRDLEPGMALWVGHLSVKVWGRMSVRVGDRSVEVGDGVSVWSRISDLTVEVKVVDLREQTHHDLLLLWIVTWHY